MYDYKDNIVRISIYKNATIINTHNNSIWPFNHILEIENKKGEKRYLDLNSKRDITDITYFKLDLANSPKKIIFEDELFFTHDL
jgi:hypothetical protein